MYPVPEKCSIPGSTLKGFCPPPLYARMNLMKGYYITTISEGAVRGDRHGPLRHHTRAFYFIANNYYIAGVLSVTLAEPIGIIHQFYDRTCRVW